jgi:anaerobic dimethyl sulfoxide reductase subunit C (anchor subunit)
MSGEWALVTFTILAQASVGGFIVLALSKQAFNKSYGAEQGEAMTLKPFVVLFPLIALTMFTSLFHLHNPVHAPFAVLNLRTSWLSREIFSISMFASAWLLYLLVVWKNIGKIFLHNVLMWVGVVAGLMAVFSMSNIYMLQVQPAWNTLMTPVIFFGSVFAIGGSLVAVVLFIVSKNDAIPVLSFGTILSAAGAVIALVGVVCRYRILNGSDIMEAVASAALMKNNYLGLYVAAIVALAAGLLISVFVYAKAKKNGFSLLYSNLALAAIVLGLVLDRVVFYSVHIKIGFGF